MKRKTKAQFVQDAKKVHKDRYDYSLVEYVNGRQSVNIICQKHGVFTQKPSSHLIGQGCPDCAGTKKVGTAKFIEKARLVHGSLYDYSLVNYINAHTKIAIVCSIHGTFWQPPNDHIKGRGCVDCSGRKTGTTSDFIAKAIKVHKGKYRYDQVEYKNRTTKVKIICPIHGNFYQSPCVHLLGCGCPLCSENGLNYSKPTYVYLLLFDKPIAKFWKVGITNLPVEKRFSDHRFISRRFLWQFDDGWQAESLEKIVLESFAGYSLPPNPKLLKTGYTECFDSCFPVEIALPFINELARRIKQK